MKLAFGKSVERVLGSQMPVIAVFVTFIVVDLTGSGTGLSAAKIFATMDLMGTLKIIMI